jgi:lysine-ketoglutarate reductase/saccharopine dehydrogenase-like protein (TIGR00300 family)
MFTMKFKKYVPPDFTQEKFVKSPNVKIALVTKKGVAPDDYHATSMYPEYFKIDGEWKLIEDSRMDCVPVLRDCGKIDAVEFRRLEVGDKAILGRDDTGSLGIYMHTNGFPSEAGSIDAFAFRASRSRETSFQKDYEALAELLRHDKDHGYIIWVLGPAAVFSDANRKAMEFMIENGFAHAIFGGNALITHDIEGAFFNTALGQDITTCENIPNGHYHHLDAINKTISAGSIENTIRDNNLQNGVIHSCVKNNVPFVMVASVRDDGPMCGVYDSMAAGQDAMRAHTQKATTVICLATQLHMIATGNLTPSYVKKDGEIRPVFIYGVDVSEFVLNKLKDRGSLESISIVANVQDFLFKLKNML